MGQIIMNRFNKKNIFIVLILFVLILATGVILNIYLSSRSVKIVFTNIKTVSVSEISPEGNEAKKPVEIVTESGKSVRLKKNNIYTVSYTGIDGYADGTQNFNPKKDGDIYLTPYFSEKKLNNILETERPVVHNLITKTYKNSNLYTYQGETLYHFGDWYSAKLKYTGNDAYNSDTLILVLRKENNTWKIINNPPSLYVSHISYPNIPDDIINSVNNF